MSWRPPSYADAAEKQNARPLAEAVAYFLKHRPVTVPDTVPDKSVSEVVPEMIDAKKAEAHSPRHNGDLTARTIAASPIH